MGFVAQVDPAHRPSTSDILEHPFIQGSELTHPTKILRDLVEKFLDWSTLGGQRTSLFLGSGAQAASDFPEERSEDVDFIFSTSRDLMQEFDPAYDSFANSPPGTLAPIPLHTKPQAGTPFSPEEPTPQISFSQDSQNPSIERRVARGGHALEAIFNESQEPYEYGIRSGDMPLDKPILSRAKSDLPLRNNNVSSSDLARKEVDVNISSGHMSDVELADADTIKQKRKQQPKEKRDTMGWKPDWDNLQANMYDESSADEVSLEPPPALPMARPALIHAETAPDRVTQASRASTATLNLDDMMGDDDWVAGSAMGSSFGSALATPMIEEPEESGDLTIVAPSHQHQQQQRSYSSSAHSREDSEAFDSYASSFADISASEDEASIPLPSASYFPSNGHYQHHHHHKHPLNVVAKSSHPSIYDPILPPSAEAMRDDAAPEVVEAELTRLLGGFNGELAALADEFPTEEDIDDEYGDGDSEEGEVDDIDNISISINGTAIHDDHDDDDDSAVIAL